MLVTGSVSPLPAPHLFNLAQGERNVEELAREIGQSVANTSFHLRTLAALAAGCLGDRQGVEEISRDELARRLEDGDVIVLDVRPGAEYAAGHIAGARSIPHDQLADRLAELPRGVEVVAYCRGPFCVYADDAVRLLRRRRRRARRLRDGCPEWRRADLPVTEGQTEAATSPGTGGGRQPSGRPSSARSTPKTSK